MRIVEPLINKEQTGRRMYRLVEQFHGDLRCVYLVAGVRRVPVADISLPGFHSLVRAIPYRRDDAPIEVVARPIRIFRRREDGMDCKKKGILLGAWARCNRVPFRFVAASSRKDRKIHHVYPELRYRGRWTNADATYSHYMLGQHNPGETTREVLTP